MSQCSVPPASTGTLAKRCTSRSRVRAPLPPRAEISTRTTLPDEAPRSTAATVVSSAAVIGNRPSAQESCRNPAVDGDQQSGGQGEVTGHECCHGSSNVLGQDLALKQ